MWKYVCIPVVRQQCPAQTFTSWKRFVALDWCQFCVSVPFLSVGDTFKDCCSIVHARPLNRPNWCRSSSSSFFTEISKLARFKIKTESRKGVLLQAWLVRPWWLPCFPWLVNHPRNWPAPCFMLLPYPISISRPSIPWSSVDCRGCMHSDWFVLMPPLTSAVPCCDTICRRYLPANLGPPGLQKAHTKFHPGEPSDMLVANLASVRWQG